MTRVAIRMHATPPAAGISGAQLRDLAGQPQEALAAMVLQWAAADFNAALESNHRSGFANPGMSAQRLAWAVAHNIKAAPGVPSGRTSVRLPEKLDFHPEMTLESYGRLLCRPLGATGGLHPSTLLAELALSVGCEQRADWQPATALPLNIGVAAKNFSDIFLSHRSFVCGFIYRKFGRRAGEPDEIVHDAWARLYRQYWSTVASRRFRGLSRIATLACCAAAGTASDNLRKARDSGSQGIRDGRFGKNSASRIRYFRRSDMDCLSNGADGGMQEGDQPRDTHGARRAASGLPLEQIGVSIDPSATMQLEELEHIVNQCVADLPPRQKLVAIMAWHQQLRQSEIAAQLGCTDENISMLLRNAREKVRQAVIARGMMEQGHDARAGTVCRRMQE